MPSHVAVRRRGIYVEYSAEYLKRRVLTNGALKRRWRTWRLSMAVGVMSRLSLSMAATSPGHSRSSSGRVASGVTSLCR
eukprot:983041-Prorocentrum_minimum.AAC.2